MSRAKSGSSVFALSLILGGALIGTTGCPPNRELDAEPDRVINEPKEETDLLPSVAPSDPSTPGKSNREGVLK